MDELRETLNLLLASDMSDKEKIIYLSDFVKVLLSHINDINEIMLSSYPDDIDIAIIMDYLDAMGINRFANTFSARKGIDTDINDNCKIRTFGIYDGNNFDFLKISNDEYDDDDDDEEFYENDIDDEDIELINNIIKDTLDNAFDEALYKAVERLKKLGIVDDDFDVDDFGNFDDDF